MLVCKRNFFQHCTSVLGLARQTFNCFQINFLGRPQVFFTVGWGRGANHRSLWVCERKTFRQVFSVRNSVQPLRTWFQMWFLDSLKHLQQKWSRRRKSKTMYLDVILHRGRFFREWFSFRPCSNVYLSSHLVFELNYVCSQKLIWIQRISWIVIDVILPWNDNVIQWTILTECMLVFGIARRMFSCLQMISRSPNFVHFWYLIAKVQKHLFDSILQNEWRFYWAFFVSGEEHLMLIFFQLWFLNALKQSGQIVRGIRKIWTWITGDWKFLIGFLFQNARWTFTHFRKWYLGSCRILIR